MPYQSPYTIPNTYNPYQDPYYVGSLSNQQRLEKERFAQQQQQQGGGGGLIQTGAGLAGTYAGANAASNAGSGGFSLSNSLGVHPYAYSPAETAAVSQAAPTAPGLAASAGRLPIPAQGSGLLPSFEAAPHGYITDAAGVNIGTGGSPLAGAPHGFITDAGGNAIGTAGAEAGATQAGAPAPPGTPIAAPVLLAVLANAAISQMTQSKKSGDDRQRDAIKNKFKEYGIIDDNYKTSTGVNVGGGLGDLTNAPGGEDYNLDHNNPLVPYLIDQINPLSRVIGQGNQKAVDDSTGILVNAVLASGATTPEEADAKLKEIFQGLTLDKGQIQSTIQGSGGGVTDRDTLMSHFDELEKGTATPGWGVRAPVKPGLVGQKEGALYRLPTGLYGEVLQRGVEDKEMAERLGAKHNPQGGLSTQELAKYTVRNDPNKRANLDLLTEEEQAIALDQLARAGYIRGGLI